MAEVEAGAEVEVVVEEVEVVLLLLFCEREDSLWWMEVRTGVREEAVAVRFWDESVPVPVLLDPLSDVVS
jgi:hypothetical protein